MDTRAMSKVKMGYEAIDASSSHQNWGSMIQIHTVPKHSPPPFTQTNKPFCVQSYGWKDAKLWLAGHGASHRNIWNGSWLVLIENQQI